MTFSPAGNLPHLGPGSPLDTDWERVKRRRETERALKSLKLSACCRAPVWTVTFNNVSDLGSPLIGQIRCETCGQPCEIAQPNSHPEQEPLFVLPAPATPHRWAVEWRWKREALVRMEKADRDAYGGLIPETWTFDRTNPWTPVLGYEKCSTERIAVNECRRLRRNHKTKEYHVVPVEWAKTGEAYIY